MLHPAGVLHLSIAQLSNCRGRRLVTELLLFLPCAKPPCLHSSSAMQCCDTAPAWRGGWGGVCERDEVGAGEPNEGQCHKTGLGLWKASSLLNIQTLESRFTGGSKNASLVHPRMCVDSACVARVRSVCQPDDYRGIVLEDLLYLREDRAPGNMQLQKALRHRHAVGPEYVCTRWRTILPPSILISCVKHPTVKGGSLPH